MGYKKGIVFGKLFQGQLKFLDDYKKDEKFIVQENVFQLEFSYSDFV